MDWVYFGLIIIFLAWSVQIFMVYSRQVDKIKAQISVTESSQEEVVLQVEDFEARGQEASAQLTELKAESDDLEKTQKELQQALRESRQKQAFRRPTRHRVETDEDVE